MRSNRLQLNADKTEMIYFTTTPASNSINSVRCRQRRHHTRLLSSRSGHLHRLRPFHTDARFQNSVGMFCNAPPSPEHPPVCHSSSTPVIGCSSDVDATRLRPFTMAGLPMRHLNRLQSVRNAATRLVYSARRSEHVSPLLRHLCWLRVPQRIEFRLTVLTYRCLNGTAPRYLANGLRRVADISSRNRLRSASTALLEVPRSKHSTIGDRAFSVTAAKAWNCLPPSITSSPSLPQFRRALKTELFRRSYGDARRLTPRMNSVAYVTT